MQAYLDKGVEVEVSKGKAKRMLSEQGNEGPGSCSFHGCCSLQ